MPRYLYWSGLGKYYSCIFGYIFRNGLYSSSFFRIFQCKMGLIYKMSIVYLDMWFISPLTISSLACFSFFVTHLRGQLHFKSQKGCCWSYSRLIFLCIVFFMLLSDKSISGGGFFGVGAAGLCRQLATWQLECLSVLECAGHYMLLTLHLSHPKHDWFDCSISWRGPLSAPHGHIWTKV